eukprot:NODE_2248_length_1251_cov_23.841930_g2047_i0.p1 GENE.NODE_2248_length_1251_cov_23.841930_g2047_i0~~NODE_2248_length_1251_cov_23.841930_g2047_i0.p1  ORF type:complete len:286 (+),score=33.97 NODE_2248_length_1251_cov_23.841930_g2047_i0:56-859(+)
MQNLSDLENTLIGACSGVSTISALQWLVYLKNARQQNLPYTLDIRVLYRGYTANAISQAGVTCVQFGTNSVMKKLLTGGKIRPLSVSEELVAGFAAGVTSSLLCSPMELVMIQQQIKQGLLWNQFTSLVRQGNIYRGFLTTSMREGVFAMGYLGITPVVRRSLRENYGDSLGRSEDSARFLGAIAGATVGVAVSHPVDTVKTCMQGDIERIRYKGTIQSFSQVVAEHGLIGVYRGGFWRWSMVVAATFLLDKAGVALSHSFFPSRFA